MRSVLCMQSWHSFDNLHHHLLLMMDFDCPLAFRHKNEKYIFEQCVLFSGGEHFCWLELVEFRLYLGASHCILPILALARFFLFCWAILVRGRYFFCFICFLFQLLIDLYL